MHEVILGRDRPIMCSYACVWQSTFISQTNSKNWIIKYTVLIVKVIQSNELIHNPISLAAPRALTWQHHGSSNAQMATFGSCPCWGTGRGILGERESFISSPGESAVRGNGSSWFLRPCLMKLRLSTSEQETQCLQKENILEILLSFHKRSDSAKTDKCVKIVNKSLACWTWQIVYNHELRKQKEQKFQKINCDLENFINRYQLRRQKQV